MQNKKIIIPLIAVVLLLAVLISVLLIDTDKAPENINSSAEPTKNYLGCVTNPDTDAITQITVFTEGESFTFFKKDDRWNARDKNISISTASVNTLAGAIGAVRYTDIIDDGSVKAEDCGIGEDSDYISFKTNDGITTLTKGINTPDGQSVYLTSDSTGVIYIADLGDVRNLFKPLTHYRNRASLKADTETLKTIEYKGDSSFTLTRGKVDAKKVIYNEWQLTKPVTMGARDEQVKAYFTDVLDNIEITGFASDKGDFKAYGIDKSRYVSITDADGKKSTVYFSDGTDGRYYICIDDEMTVYSVEKSAAPYVSVQISDIFERNIHLVKMADIASVTIEGEALVEVKFTADGGSINGKKISAEQMNNKVFPAVCGLFADDLCLEAKGNAAVTIVFKYTDSSSDILTFADYDDRYYTVSKNGSAKYLILKHKVSDMIKTLNETE